MKELPEAGACYELALDGVKSAKLLEAALRCIYLGTPMGNGREAQSLAHAWGLGSTQRVQDESKDAQNEPVMLLAETKEDKHATSDEKKESKDSQGDYQKYMKGQGGDYQKYMKGQGGDYQKYMKGQGGDYQKYMQGQGSQGGDYQKYMQGQGSKGGDYQKYMQQYSGDYQKYMKGQGSQGGDYQKYMQGQGSKGGDYQKYMQHTSAAGDFKKYFKDYEQYIKSEGKDAADGMKGFVDKYAKDYEQSTAAPRDLAQERSGGAGEAWGSAELLLAEEQDGKQDGDGRLGEGRNEPLLPWFRLITGGISSMGSHRPKIQP
eukprot:g16849.t1